MRVLLRNISKTLIIMAALFMLAACEKKDNAENYAAEILILPDDGVVVQAHFPNDLSDETWAPMWRTDTVKSEYSILSNIQARPGAEKKYNVKRCYYGHLHGISISDAIEGNVEGIEFKLVSADSMDFKLLKI